MYSNMNKMRQIEQKNLIPFLRLFFHGVNFQSIFLVKNEMIIPCLQKYVYNIHSHCDHWAL